MFTFCEPSSPLHASEYLSEADLAGLDIFLDTPPSPAAAPGPSYRPSTPPFGNTDSLDALLSTLPPLTELMSPMPPPAAGAPRPRGRPRGSKNKLKANPSSSSDPPCKKVVIRIPAGRDIAEAIATFRRERNLGFSVKSCVGSVTQPALVDPVGKVFLLDGKWDVQRLTGVYFPSMGTSETLLLTLVGENGKVEGGKVNGPLVAAGPVEVALDVFTNPIFHDVPAALPGDRGDISSVVGSGNWMGVPNSTNDDVNNWNNLPPLVSPPSLDAGVLLQQLPWPLRSAL